MACRILVPQPGIEFLFLYLYSSWSKPFPSHSKYNPCDIMLSILLLFLIILLYVYISKQYIIRRTGDSGWKGVRGKKKHHNGLFDNFDLFANNTEVNFLDLMKCEKKINRCFSSVQSLSRVWLFATPWIAACQASLSITISRSSLKVTSIELVMPSSHLILCRPLFLMSAIPPSIRVFSSESTLHMMWPKYWSFSFSIPSKEHSGLISFRMDWLDFLAVQGTLKSLLQHHSSKASILQRSALCTVQLSHPYMTTGKTVAWTEN